MMLTAIEGNFTCSCGAPFIVMTLDSAPGDKITALLICPRHRVGHHLTLDHSAIDLWATIVADHLYRCALCGRELSPVTGVSSSEIATTFTLTCPIHGTQNNTRTIWSVLYRRLLSEVQQQRAPQTPPTIHKTQLTELPKQATQTSKEGPEPGEDAQFCPQCGKKIRPKDNFCFHCGAAID